MSVSDLAPVSSRRAPNGRLVMPEMTPFEVSGFGINVFTELHGQPVAAKTDMSCERMLLDAQAYAAVKSRFGDTATKPAPKLLGVGGHMVFGWLGLSSIILERGTASLQSMIDAELDMVTARRLSLATLRSINAIGEAL